jgi:hypothetical protein
MAQNSILNVIMQFLAYSDAGVTDAPSQKNFDWTKKIYSVPATNPRSDTEVIAPGDSLVLFNGVRASGLDNTSVLDVAGLSNTASGYRFTVSAGAAGFRTDRAVGSLGLCQVTVNNSSTVIFDFTGFASSVLSVGDVMRVAGQITEAAGPFAFNPLNAGDWKVIAKSGSKVTCVRPIGQPFSAVSETVAVTGTDVSFYSAAGLQIGDKVSITDTFSPVTQRVYVITDVTPTTFDVVATDPIPLESGLSYVPGSLTFYTESKRLVYVEADQDCVVRFNNDTSDSVKLSPIKTSDAALPGFISKWGDAYTCEVVNKSTNALTIKFLTVE